MEPQIPPRNKRGLRTGYTTGACSAAAAKAAARVLVKNTMLTEIETTLPNRQRVRFALKRCERAEARAICSVIKDAGDDPDCTHGAELVAEVELSEKPGVEICGGPGVATVTKSGLGLELGGAAINPVPRRNIREMVLEELEGTHYKGAVVTVSVPGGEELAKQTLNARLGLLGGISILGTSGIVKPYSTAAFRASVVQAIDVAKQRRLCEIVVTTGGKSESYAMALRPELAEEAFVQMGDFVGVALKHAERRGIERVTIVGMVGKLSKMADGKLQTHAAGSDVNMDLLAEIAGELGAPPAIAEQIRAANTARHVLEICTANGLGRMTRSICERVVGHATRHTGGKLEVHALLVDFNGKPLARFPDALPAPAKDSP
jgi:cobalt-precorrin-5B (C1)-methyltransferase